MSDVTIYTDGACSGNPGPGGWAFILRCPRTGKELQMSDGMANSTNNQMELQAVLEGLKLFVNVEPCEILLYSDSQYVTRTINEWLPN
jgi:ribonuclease HI